jgi:hypothetical protein
MGVLRIFAILFGLIFVAMGVAGFMPMFITDGKLLGLFMVDDLHNIVHVVSGVIALLAAANSRVSKVFFILFGLIYVAVTVLGFMGKEDVLMMHFNMADNVLHLVIAIVFLFLGLFVKALPA